MTEYINNCFCCGYYLISRYKRVVNNLFPQNPQHGLDGNNLQRLRFYAVRRPEKLDKVFHYLCSKIARYLHNRNRPYVILGIKAMNDIVKSCYQLLNTFVDDYLETLRLILEERDDLELIEHAVASFESFCEIREEAPNYQRNYQFFVHRFTALCYYTAEVNEKKLRCLGLRGHLALFRKTANDELQNDACKYMEQIIPSIIFNMEVKQPNPTSDLSTAPISSEDIIILNQAKNNDDTSTLADIILCDIFNRAHSNNYISICVQLILAHLDRNEKWIPDDFSRYIFSQIMKSIKHHNSYIITDLLLNHLDEHLTLKDPTDIRTSIMNVIHDCLILAALNTGARPTIFTRISSLLNFLKRSFQIGTQRTNTSFKYPYEHQFQTAVIDGIDGLADELPDFQIIEILQCIASELLTIRTNIDEATRDSNPNFRFQLSLLKTMQKIILKNNSRRSSSSKIIVNRQSEESLETTPTLTTFPHQLFDPLIKLMNTPEVEIRFLVLEILQLLVDRKHCADKISRIKIIQDISQLNLPTEIKRSRLSDIAFMKKFGHHFLSQLYKCILLETNTKNIFYAIYCLMNLVTIEADDQDVLVDVIHFCFEIQSTIIKMAEQKLPNINYNGIHALIAAYFNLISKLYTISGFSFYVDQIIRNREQNAPYLLPPEAFRSASKENLLKSISENCRFDKKIIVNALEISNYKISTFNRTIHFETESNSPGDENDEDSEIESHHGSTIDIRSKTQNEDISFRTILNALQNDESSKKRSIERRNWMNNFRTKPLRQLQVLVNEKNKKTDKNIQKLLINRKSSKEQLSMKMMNGQSKSNEELKLVTNNYNYPELFTF